MKNRGRNEEPGEPWVAIGFVAVMLIVWLPVIVKMLFG
jgi:hypothetical protein